MKTIGEKRVGVEFNPSKNETVDLIKQKGAELINLIHSIEPTDKSNPGECRRAQALAMTEVENGLMWAVKANFR